MCSLEQCLHATYILSKIIHASKGWIQSTNATNQRCPSGSHGWILIFSHRFHREMSHKKMKISKKNSIQQKSVSKLYPVPNHLFWVSTVLKIDFPWFKFKTQVVNRCLKLFHLILFPPSTFRRGGEAKKLSHEMLGWHKDEVHKRKDF